jgi:sec-independent protein translocase protein TatA
MTMHFPSLPGLLVALIAGLLLFGTKRLPEMGASLGQGIREFKKSLQEIGDAADVESPAPGLGAADLGRPISPNTPSPAEPRRLTAPTTSDGRGVTS